MYVLVKEGVTILGCDGVNCSDLTFSESLGFNVSLGVTNMNAIKAKYDARFRFVSSLPCLLLTPGHSVNAAASTGQLVKNMACALASPARYPLCAMEQYTHLSATSPAINDYAGNPMALALRGIYSGLDPVHYVIDETRPELDSFALDMNAGTLTLYFSEVRRVWKNLTSSPRRRCCRARRLQ